MSCGRTYDLGGSQRVDPIEIVDRTAAIFRPLAQAERVPMPTGLHELEYPTAATDKGCVAFFDTRENMLAFMDWLTALAAPGDGE